MQKTIWGIIGMGLLAYSFAMSNVGQYSHLLPELYFSDPDTTIIINDLVGVGSRIMTDQDALVVLPPDDSKLLSVDLYYSSVQTINGDSSRIYVKSLPSWSCGQNGGSHPFQTDIYTIGISKNIAVAVGWNHYTFDHPLDISADSIFIWPDLIQQIQPRITFATGNNHPDIMRMNGTFCGNASGRGTHSTDFACSLSFVSDATCVTYLEVTDIDSNCYAADSIHADVEIGANQNISFFSKDQVILDTTFEISQMTTFCVDMYGCID